MLVRLSSPFSLVFSDANTQDILAVHAEYSPTERDQVEHALSSGDSLRLPLKTVFVSSKVDASILQVLLRVCEECCQCEANNRPQIPVIRQMLLQCRGTSPEALLRRLLLNFKELDLTSHATEGYTDKINGGCADIFIRTLANNITVAEKSIRFFDADDREKTTKVCSVASLTQLIQRVCYRECYES